MEALIYLDHAATTPMRPGVWDAMAPFAADSFGNSSGVHGISRRAKNALEEARERVAQVIGAEPNEIVFTSGGTESDNLALKGPVYAGSPRSAVVVGAAEHEAVLETADFLRRSGSPVAIVEADGEGRIRPEAVASRISDETAVASVMLVNNETGTVNDLEAITSVVKGRSETTLVHTDAVQAFASMKLDVKQLGVDLLTLTGHKFGGPKGSGVLYVRGGTTLEPLLHGGGQELGRRSGTHDVAGAVGLAKAMELAASDRDRFVSVTGSLRDRLRGALCASIPELVVNTPETGSSPHHLNVRIPGVRNETLLMRLDDADVAASAGSACQSGAATVSHVLEAMGLTPAEARESIRLTLGWTTTEQEVDEAAAVIVDLVGKLR